LTFSLIMALDNLGSYVNPMDNQDNKRAESSDS